MSSWGACPECGGPMQPRQSGFAACLDCGKLLLKPPPAPAPSSSYDADTKAELDAKLEELDLAMPDYADVMEGWRAWGVKDAAEGEIPLLKSVTYTSAAWWPGEYVEATCKKAHANGVPDENCTCGLYSAKTYEHLMSMSYHKYDADRQGMFHVVGPVKLWGKVIEGTQGWRAQFGYPKELYVPFEAWHLALPLGEAYGVPVKLKNFLQPPVKPIQ